MSDYEEQFFQAFRAMIETDEGSSELKLPSNIKEDESEANLEVLQSILALSENLRETLDLVTKQLMQEVESSQEPLQQKEQRESTAEKVRELFETMQLTGVSAVPKSPEKRHKSRQKEQLYFAERVLNDVLNFYGLECLKEEVEEVPNIYKESMGQAVVAISLLYRDEWRQTFELLSKSSTEPEAFIAYCHMVPAEKYNAYFFSVLQRIAVIFELALYFFELDCDYFEIAMHCAADFMDADFFVDAGGWEKLERAADLISILISPLRNVLSCDKRGLRSFEGVYQNLANYENVECRRFSRQYKLFRDLDTCFKEEMEEPQRKDLLHSTEVGSKSYYLKRYFMSCCEDYFKVKNEKCPLFKDYCYMSENKDYSIELGSWMYVPVEKHPEVTAASNITKESEYKTKSDGFKIKGKGKKSRGSSGATNIQMNELEKATGTVPRSKTKQRKLPYTLVQIDHCGDILKLYRNIFPSFLKTYLHNSFIPVFYETDDTSNKKLGFLLERSMLTDRIIETNKEPCMRSRLYGSCPSGYECPIPLDIERILDNLIANRKFRPVPLPVGHQLFLVCDDDDDERKEIDTWNIRRNLENDFKPEDQISEAIRKYKNFIKDLKRVRTKVQRDHQNVCRRRLIEEKFKPEVESKLRSEPESETSSEQGTKFNM